MLSDAEDTEEEAPLGHEGESLSLDLLESSNNEDEDDDRTGVKHKNCNIDNGGDRNTGAGGGFEEWIRFHIPSTLTEALSAMAKSEASLLTASKKN